jgi:hypothetical protein
MKRRPIHGPVLFRPAIRDTIAWMRYWAASRARLRVRALFARRRPVTEAPPTAPAGSSAPLAETLRDWIHHLGTPTPLARRPRPAGRAYPAGGQMTGVAIHQVLPPGSITPQRRSPYSWVSGSWTDRPPAAIARLKAASTSSE